MIPFDPALAKALGKHDPSRKWRCNARTDALFMAQVHYWTAKGNNQHDGCSWVYNSQAAWAEQLGASDKMVQNSLARLVRLGVFISMQNPHLNLDRRPWLRIDYKACAKLKLPFPQKGESTHPIGPIDTPNRVNGHSQSGESIHPIGGDNNRRVQQKTTDHESASVNRASTGLSDLQAIRRAHEEKNALQLLRERDKREGTQHD